MPSPFTATILATCGGWRPSERASIELSPLQEFAVELAGVTGRATRIGFIGTAGGDQRHGESDQLIAARLSGHDARHIRLFDRRDEDLRAALADLDVVWVDGGSVVNLLAIWRAHALDAALREAGDAGVVLAGSSAGALCWHRGGPTSSFGPSLTVETDALGFVDASLAVHYDSQPRRRPLMHEAVATGLLPDGYGVDEGAAVLYRGGQFIEAVSETPGAQVFAIRRAGADAALEEPLPTRLLD
jgi:peptidase E